MSTEQVMLTAEAIKAENLVLKTCRACKVEFWGVYGSTDLCMHCYAVETNDFI